MNKLKKAITFFFVLASGLILSSCTKTYDHDIDFVYKTVSEHHPGIYNSKDPSFMDHLKKHYKLAKKNPTKESLESFVKSFDDTHVWIHWNEGIEQEEDPTNRNFQVSWYNNHREIVHLKIPTFSLDDDQQKQFYEFLKQIPNSKDYKIMILDIKGNQGGNSDFAHQINDVLFGKAYADSKRRDINHKTYVNWRATEENLNHIKELYQLYKQDWIKSIIIGIENSIKNQDPYFKEFLYNDYKRESRPLLNHNHFFVLIDSNNVSAALDFIDDLKSMTKHVTLVGQKTKADRLYTDVRSVSLPSKEGTFSFPIKVYSDRLRPDNEGYRPNINEEEMLKKINRLLS